MRKGNNFLLLQAGEDFVDTNRTFHSEIHSGMGIELKAIAIRHRNRKAVHWNSSSSLDPLTDDTFNQMFRLEISINPNRCKLHFNSIGIPYIGFRNEVA